MKVSVNVENEAMVRAQFSATAQLVEEVVAAQLKEHGAELLAEIKATAPVDTGRYKGNWVMKADGLEVQLRNSTRYAQALVFPNEQMVNAQGADVPSRGILHNVKGLVFSKRSKFSEKLQAKVNGVLE